jgi:hypothetical protein
VEKKQIGSGVSMMSQAISVTISEQGTHHVNIFDVNGKQVYSTSPVGPAKLDVPGLKSGIYFVKVASAKKSRVEKISLLY